MRQFVQPLERRRLFAFDLPDGMFSQPDDTYTLTIGTLIPSLDLRAIAYAMSRPGGSTVTDTGFNLAAPTGVSTPTLFQLAASGQPQTVVTIAQKTASGATRCLWTLRNVIVSSFSQSSDNTGIYDQFNLQYSDRFAWAVTRFNEGGAVIGTSTLEWRKSTGQFLSVPGVVETNYLSTSAAVPNTFEVGTEAPRSQMPLLGFNYGVSGGGPTVSSPVSIVSSAGAEELRLLHKMLSGGGGALDTVYTHRDASGQVDTRWRFTASNFTEFAFSDSVGDADARVDAWTEAPSRAQNSAFTYTGPKIDTPITYGWDFGQGMTWTPTTISAHIAQPTSGPTNTPVDFINIQFTSAVPSLTLSAFVFENISAGGLTLTTTNGGLDWRLGNLAPSQTIDRDYAVKLFGFGSGIANFVGSIGKTWRLDTSGPNVVDTAFGFEGLDPAPFDFEFDLSEPVQVAGGSLPILIRRASTGTLVTTVFGSVSVDGLSVTAPLANILDDADYTATLPAGSVRDAAGNLIATDTVLPFFILAGDVNRDRKVDFGDLLILAQNYGQSNRTFAQGNVDYSADRAVNFGDLLVLAQHYGAALSVGVDATRERMVSKILT